MGAIPRSFVPDETDVIEQQLDDTLDTYAPLAALHDAGGMWDHMRKIVLAEAREEVRKNATEKMTETRIDDLARISLPYRNYIDAGITEREEFFRQKNIRIEHYIRRRELDKRSIR